MRERERERETSSKGANTKSANLVIFRGCISYELLITLHLKIYIHFTASPTNAPLDREDRLTDASIARKNAPSQAEWQRQVNNSIEFV